MIMTNDDLTMPLMMSPKTSSYIFDFISFFVLVLRVVLVSCNPLADWRQRSLKLLSAHRKPVDGVANKIII